MYCKYCGKPTDNPEAICEDCAKQLTNTDNDNQQKSTVENKESKYTRMYGFGLGLASVILSVVDLIILSTMMVFYWVPISKVGFYVGLAIFIIIGILSMVFGFISIGKFKEARSNNGKKPLATLILGISGVSLSVLSFFLAVLIPVYFKALEYFIDYLDQGGIHIYY